MFQFCIIVELLFVIPLSLLITASLGLLMYSKHKCSKGTIDSLYSTLYPRGSFTSQNLVPTNSETEHFPYKRTDRDIAHSPNGWRVRMKFLATYLLVKIMVCNLYRFYFNMLWAAKYFCDSGRGHMSNDFTISVGYTMLRFEPCNDQESDWEFVYNVMGSFFDDVKRGHTTKFIAGFINPDGMLMAAISLMGNAGNRGHFKLGRNMHHVTFP